MDGDGLIKGQNEAWMYNFDLYPQNYSKLKLEFRFWKILCSVLSASQIMLRDTLLSAGKLVDQKILRHTTIATFDII